MADIDNFNGKWEEAFDIRQGIQLICSQANFFKIGTERQVRNLVQLRVGTAQLGQIRERLEHFIRELFKWIVGED